MTEVTEHARTQMALKMGSGTQEKWLLFGTESVPGSHT